jgi:fatty-acyl-CoA synthase
MQAPRTLPGLLEARAASATPALIERDRPVSYAHILDESRRVAAGLAGLGVAAGDRVALWLPNVPAWLTTFFACAQLGAIAVAVNTRFRAHELADIVSRSGCKVLVFWPGFQRADFSGVLAACAPEALARIASVVVYAETGESVPSSVLGRPATAFAALAASAPMAASAAHPDAGCAIFTTSGTTKAPKFVLHDQKTLVAHAFDVVRGFGLHAKSVSYLAPPLCGVFGACNALAAIAAGRPLVMTPSWDAAEALRQIDRHGVTHLNATDDAIAQLLAATPRTPALPTVEFMGYAAFNPALETIVARADARGLKVVGLYGISEIQALFARQDQRAPPEDRKLAGGRPVSAAARVRARDPQSGRVLPHEEPGELEFLAPGSRMAGYFGDPDSTAAALTEDGWYRSGDLGYTQADGRFVYLARMGDSLRLSGFLVSPLEIEGVVQEVEGIDGCQVVGVTVGTTAGNSLKPVGFVTLKPGGKLDEAAAIRHVAARLAKYKVPVRLYAIDAFPVTEGTNATKIQKHKLRDLAQAKMTGGDPS